MKVHYSQFVKANHTTDSAREILDSPIDVLVGVDDEDVSAMGHLNIETVYDLATSRVFNLAREITMAADGDGESPMAAHGFTPSDATASGERQSIKELAVDDISSLPGIGEEFDDDVREAIALTTVRDFSLWPPFLAARAVLTALTGESEQTENDEIPDELVPVARQYATERVFYDKAYLDEVIDLEEIEADDRRSMFGVWENRIFGRSVSEDRPIPDLNPLNGEIIDITNADTDESGFTEPALGALLSFSQSWYPEGLSLGQLLHSMTLAPGESTKMAVVDWSRDTSTDVDESIAQSEQVSATMRQKRSVGEVQKAVASSVEEGSSTVENDTITGEKGEAEGFMLGTLFGGGKSSGRSRTTGKARTVSTTSGRREISASMSQTIQGATQQQASSVRNRRASVVKEVSQSESEEVTTRTVTNYNHMHSLNMHYYEVVQMYRTAVQPEKAEPVLFIPFALIDFTEEHVISHYRSVLLRHALDSRTLRLVEDLSGAVTANIAVDHEPINSVPTSFIRNGFRAIGDGWEIPPEQYFSGFNFYGLAMGIEEVLVYLHESSSPITLETEFVENWDGALQASYTTGLDTPIPVSQIEKIEVRHSDRSLDLDDEDRYYSFRMHIKTEGQFDSESSTPLSGRFEELRTGLQTLIDFSLPADYAQLSRLLMEEQLYYSQAIWNELDSQTVAMLLSTYRLGSRPLAEYIDTTPLATHGNYVAFRLSLPDVSDEDSDGSLADEIEELSDRFLRYALTWWLDWKDRNYNPTHMEEDLVPLPSGGVHGEAVLGRANAAEKLDLTRFWDWQESPIPIQAPDIGPVATGSRGTQNNVMPGSLDAPIVNIQTPPSLPDPTGVSAVLNAVTTSNLFRDMSGLDAAAALAEQGMSVTGEGASNAATLASQNYRTAAETYIRAMEATAALAAAAMGVPAGAGGSNSGFGGLLNQAEKLDKSKANGSGSPGGTTPGNNGNSPGGEGSGGGSGAPSTPSLQEELVRARGNPAGNLGIGSDDIVLAQSNPDSGTSPTTDVARQEWDSHPAIHHFYNNPSWNPRGFELYRSLRPAYVARGITNPAQYLDDNIEDVTAFGDTEQLHIDLREPLQQAEATLQPNVPTVEFGGGFVPRAIRGGTNLSNHAFGRAVDVNIETNFRITAAIDFRVIEAVTGVALNQQQDYQTMRDASQQFQAEFGNWVTEQQSRYDELEDTEEPLTPEQITERDQLENLLNEVEQARTRGGQNLNTYASRGFLNLESRFVDAMEDAGFTWGGSYQNSKDFHHFEIPLTTPI